MILGVGEIALGWSRSSRSRCVLMVAVGFGGILMAATANTTIQLAVPDGLRGRVMSVYTTIFAGSTPIGGPAMGGIASLFGIAVSLAVGGVLSLGVGGAPSPGCAARGSTASRASRGSTSRRVRRGHHARAGVAAFPPVRRGSRRGAGSASATRRPEDQCGVEPAEPERGREHAPVGAVAALRSRPGRSAATSGSGVSRFTEAGAQPSRMASAQIAASIAPEAPSGWPYSAFVPLTGTVAARPPRAEAIARASATSPIGVDDACALT